MAAKRESCYTLGDGYKNCKVFTFNSETRRRIGTTTLTPEGRLTRMGRYKEIAAFLTKRRIPVPEYIPL